MHWTLELGDLSSIVWSFKPLVQEAQYLSRKKLGLPQRLSPIRGGLLGLKLLQCPPELELMTVCSILVDGNGRRFSITRQGRVCVSAYCLFLFFFPSIALPVGLFETPVSFLSLVLHMTCHPLTGLELLHRKIQRRNTCISCSESQLSQTAFVRHQI